MAGTQSEGGRSQGGHLGSCYSRLEVRSCVPGPGWKQQTGEGTDLRTTVETETPAFRDCR